MNFLDDYNKSIILTALDLSNLHNSILLEQRQTLCLRQAPLAQLYYVCDTQTSTLFLRTDQWTEAYQCWLQLNGQSFLSCPLASPECLSIIELCRLIDGYRENPEFGQLLYSRDRQFQGVLQYSVQLSVDSAIRWSASTKHPIGLGEFIIEKVGRRRHRLAKWVEQHPHNFIADILVRSIEAFHQCWDYNLYQFNSEHWARLAVTGYCHSLQTEDLYHYWQNTQRSSDCATLEAEPTIWENNSEIVNLLQMAIAP